MKSLLLVLFIVSTILSNDSAFIYGKVVLKNGREYQGSIRWGKDYGKEHFWLDTFDASKRENTYADLVDYREFRNNSEKKGFFASLGRLFDKRRPETHVFECHFGDIKQINALRKNRAEVILKNNEHYEVSGSDVGKTIYILNEKTGEEKKVNWSRLDYVEFLETPEKLNYSFGNPLYGVVETEAGTYEGYVQWDYDESLLEDELDGDERELNFDEIDVITKEGRRAVEVQTTEGRNRYLSGTNDVDKGNRGIVIKNFKFGKIEVDWDEFVSFTIKKAPKNSSRYSDFKTPDYIKAEIILDDNKSFTGRIAYDLDETYDLEFLNGSFEKLKFNVPFRNIRSIERIGRHSSEINLKSGKTIELENERDVNSNNDGILIWEKGNSDPIYKRWQDIKKITLL